MNKTYLASYTHIVISQENRLYLRNVKQLAGERRSSCLFLCVEFLQCTERKKGTIV